MMQIAAAMPEAEQSISHPQSGEQHVQSPSESEVTLTLAKAAQWAADAYQRADWSEAENTCRLILNVRPDHFEALNVLGAITARTGRTREALELLSRAVSVNPGDAEAHNNRGNALADLGRPEAALESCERAIALRPDFAEAHNNRGVALAEIGRPEAALESYDKAIALEPDFAEAHNNRGNALADLGCPEAALECYERAIALRPDYAEAWNNRGSALRSLGRPEAALASYERAIALRPEYAKACNNHGSTLWDLGRPEAALKSYERAIALRPDFAEAYYNRGNALADLGHTGAALESYEQAIALKADYAEAWNNRGVALASLKRHEAALESYERAIALRPAYAEAWNNRGNALSDLKRPEAALESYERAIALTPAYAEAWNNRGNALSDLKHPGPALESYERAIALTADHAAAHFNLAICRLRLGDFARGWEAYEWRWEVEELATDRRDFPQPLWLGMQSLAGKTILLHSEQGFGDTLHFCRYAKLVAALGANVVLEVQPALLPLLGNLEGTTQVLPRGDPLPAFDYRCPLMSLPLAFKTDLNDIPAGIPYIRSDARRVAAWQKKLGIRTGLRIGLAWRGNKLKKDDRNRSIALEELLPLVSGQAEWISLQKELRETDAELLASRADIRHTGDQLLDFADTAALVELMDLVITVDTSVAHLAGAMGKAVWILLPFNPDWRWLLDREDSAWYPTARLYRQPAFGDWSSVIRRVREELSGCFARYGGRAPFESPDAGGGLQVNPAGLDQDVKS